VNGASSSPHGILWRSVVGSNAFGKNVVENGAAGWLGPAQRESGVQVLDFTLLKVTQLQFSGSSTGHPLM
jgi:hypothetical protein